MGKPRKAPAASGIIDRVDSAMTSAEADRLDTAAGARELLQFHAAGPLVALGRIHCP